MGKAMGKAANKSTCHGTEQQEAKRDSKGRWKPGRSGNPAGPKPGNSARVLLMARNWAEAKGFHTRIPEHSRGTGLSKEWIQLAHTLLSPNMELHEAIEVCRSSLLAQTPILPSLDFTP